MVLPTTTSSSRRISATRRRRKRKNDYSYRVAASVVVIIIAITFTIHHLIGQHEQQQEGNAKSTTINAAILQNWKPKPKRKTTAITNPDDIPSVEDLEVDQRAQQREDRYNSLYQPKFDATTLGYDIHNCPHTPPDNYPMKWLATEVLSNWNPKEVTTTTSQPRNVHHSLCIFDHETQYAKALNYRNLEKPFIIRNDPKVTSVSKRWEDNPDYLHRVLGDVEEYRTERSPNNQFMWYRLRGHNKAGPEGYVKPPNDEIEMTFGEWLEHAIEKDGVALGDEELIKKASSMRQRRMSLTTDINNIQKKEEGELEDDPLNTDLGDDKDGEEHNDGDSEETKRSKYYYFRINADLRNAGQASTSKFIYDELTFFDPRKRRDSQFYIVDPKSERGINCRFGMRGVTAANHFDMSRNMIALFGGERRYILADPSQCKNMALYPQGHPSVRHSSFDWSNPLEWDDHPEFKEAYVNEVVLHAGDVLYLPTNTFHYIVNLSLNYQCNARSGTTFESAHVIEDCGFHVPHY